MSTDEPRANWLRPPRHVFIAPACLVITYWILGLFSETALPAPKLVLATLIFLTVIWWKNILGIVRNVSGDTRNERIFLLGGMFTFAFVWVVAQFVVDSQMFIQRLFTIGPAIVGLMWLAFRNVEEVPTRKGLWRWWSLNSPRFRSFAATVYGTAFLVRSLLNEFFIYLGSDLLWVLSCAVLAVAVRWIADVVVFRGLVARGAEVRHRANT